MLDWRTVSADPTDREASVRIDAFLRDITQIEKTSRLEMLLDFCRDAEVLDIGAGEHDPSFYTEGSWEHGLICKVAKRAVAVEISPELCAHYQARGFDFRCLDATSDVDLGERFDRIFMGDVIEHVNDPVRLLTFAKRHLKAGGALLVTTPNPFAPRFRRLRREWKSHYVPANLEHTRWISITNMVELSHRAGLELTALRWPLMKKPKTGAAAAWDIAAKQALLAVRPVEDVFAEYAFQLALPGQEP